MKPLYTESEFRLKKLQEKLPLECYQCGCRFMKLKHDITKTLKKSNSSVACKYCSNNCRYAAQVNRVEVPCKQCNKTFPKLPNQIAKFPNHFCSRSCAATFHNTHKNHGTKRSKLEVWLAEQLPKLYPTTRILFNDKTTINSELDVYFPSLRLAFELNGIFHYEPIYGKSKLAQIQNNDNRKFQACLEKNIQLCIIDTSSLNYFKPDKAQKFLDIICEIINKQGD